MLVIANHLRVISYNTRWIFLRADVEWRDCNVDMMMHIIFFLYEEIAFVTRFLFFHFLLTDRQTHTSQGESYVFSPCDNGALEPITQHNRVSKIIQLRCLNILKYFVIRRQGSCRTHVHCSTLVVPPLRRLRRGSSGYGNVSLVTSETHLPYFVRILQLPAPLTSPERNSPPGLLRGGAAPKAGFGEALAPREGAGWGRRGCPASRDNFGAVTSNPMQGRGTTTLRRAGGARGIAPRRAAPGWGSPGGKASSAVNLQLSWNRFYVIFILFYYIISAMQTACWMGIGVFLGALTPSSLLAASPLVVKRHPNSPPPPEQSTSSCLRSDFPAWIGAAHPRRRFSRLCCLFAGFPAGWPPVGAGNAAALCRRMAGAAGSGCELVLRRTT